LGLVHPIRKADERIEFLKGDGKLWTLQDGGTLDRVPQGREPGLLDQTGTKTSKNAGHDQRVCRLDQGTQYRLVGWTRASLAREHMLG
jgi:hypothetical protein